MGDKEKRGGKREERRSISNQSIEAFMNERM
jgi:hypothetical protein